MEHKNNYLESEYRPLACVSTINIVIPLYNGNEMFDRVLPYISYAVNYAKQICPALTIFVTVVDDGSDIPYFFPSGFIGPEWNIIRHMHNEGRARARNTGLKFHRECKYTIFMDADIIPYPEAIIDCIAKQERYSSNRHSCVICGLFHFTNTSVLNSDCTDFSFCNDFRMHCVYQDSWIGCESDMKYIGREFNIIKDTAEWSKWPSTGFLGPWSLPNMVLGGLFCVNTSHALSVGGLDERFSVYGFEETTLVTNLIIKKGAYIIPILNGFSKHIENDDESNDRANKNILFREAYAHYYFDFMKEKLSDVKGPGYD